MHQQYLQNSNDHYESNKTLDEYMAFHYAPPDEYIKYPFCPRDALDFPVRCAQLAVCPTQACEYGVYGKIMHVCMAMHIIVLHNYDNKYKYGEITPCQKMLFISLFSVPITTVIKINSRRKHNRNKNWDGGYNSCFHCTVTHMQ